MASGADSGADAGTDSGNVTGWPGGADGGEPSCGVAGKADGGTENDVAGSCAGGGATGVVTVVVVTVTGGARADVAGRAPVVGSATGARTALSGRRRKLDSVPAPNSDADAGGRCTARTMRGVIDSKISERPV